ncbi:ABC transporter ATP-binding protein [Eubacterium callanderi]|uniref:ABC transporter ATP-binding protein n=1 Tax=Eubacterium callanderi TaxID=53442 RepID=UPI003907EE41
MYKNEGGVSGFGRLKKMALVEIRNMMFTYPEMENPALKDINLKINDGEFVVLCGKSGCGKSTLLRHFKTVLTPHGTRSGEICFKNQELSNVDIRTQSSEIGFVLQNPDNQIVTDKVWHELAFGLESLGYDTPTIRLRVAEMASYFGIQAWFRRNVNELSGGQKQLLNLAAIMAMHPSLLILDEPTSQLDPIAASDFLETVRKINRDLGTTVIMTEHRLEDIFPAADKVIVMDEGRIITEGLPKEIGKQLRGMEHDMFLSMPAPMQIYAGIDNDMPCPLTVREGRQWLSELFADRLVTKSSIPIEEDSYALSETVVELKDVWFRYERDLPDVVRDLSLKVKKGQLYALVGGNGTGKTTTLSLISGINRPYRGRVWLEGREVKKYSDKELFHGFLGVLPQNPQSLFVKKTVELDLFEAIGGTNEHRRAEFNSDMEKRTAVNGMAKLMHIEHLMQQHPYDLSGGEQQRLALAKIMLLKPRILLMDEPTKGLDNHFKRELAEILKRLQEHGVTIIMVSHDVEFCAQYADTCGLFFEGNIVTSNTPRAFFSGNSFYTTSANRLSRHLFENAITVKDVITCCQMNLQTDF